MKKTLVCLGLIFPFLLGSCSLLPGGSEPTVMSEDVTSTEEVPAQAESDVGESGEPTVGIDEVALLLAESDGSADVGEYQEWMSDSVRACPDATPEELGRWAIAARDALLMAGAQPVLPDGTVIPVTSLTPLQDVLANAEGAEPGSVDCLEVMFYSATQLGREKGQRE